MIILIYLTNNENLLRTRLLILAIFLFYNIHNCKLINNLIFFFELCICI